MMNGNEMDMALCFIPLLRGFGVPRVFLQSWAPLSTGCWRHVEHAGQGDGIPDLFAVHFVFSTEVRLLCLFVLRFGGWK